MSKYDPIYNSGSLTNVNSRVLFSSLKEYIDDSKGTIYIIVPFISNKILGELLNDVSNNEVCIVTSWRADHLVSGVSSLDLYEICKEKHWALYVNSSLHCKIYSDAFNSCIITSANCTDRALKNEKGNIESCILLNELNVGNRVELNKIVYESVRVNDWIYEQYLIWYNQLEKNPTDTLEEPIIIDVSPYYISQLPATDNPEQLWNYACHPQLFRDTISELEHDLAIYSSNPFGFDNRNDFFDDICHNFKKHPFIGKIEENIPERGINFGKFKAVVQKYCSDTPLPFKKDLTHLTHNLYQWFVELFPDEYYWDVPGSHSQVLHRNRSVKY